MKKETQNQKQQTAFSKIDPEKGIVMLILPGTESKLNKDEKGNPVGWETITIPHDTDEESLKEMFLNLGAALLPKGYEILNFGNPLEMYQSLGKRLQFPKDPAHVVDLKKENLKLADELKAAKKDIIDLRIQVASLELKVKESKK